MSGLHQTGPRVPSGNWETGTNLPEVSLGSGRRESEVSAQNSYDYHHKLFGKNSPPYHWEENPCVEAEMTTMYVDLDFFLLAFPDRSVFSHRLQMEVLGSLRGDGSCEQRALLR